MYLENVRVRFFANIQDQIKNPDHEEFFVKKGNDVSKKKIIFIIHFHRNDPLYRRIPEKEDDTSDDTVASLLSFYCILTISTKILLALDGPNEEESCNEIMMLRKVKPRA